jgi:hypothetical protein
MKKVYTGLTTERVTVRLESPLMVGSNQKIKAKKSNTEWKEENVEVEDMSGFTNSAW